MKFTNIKELETYLNSAEPELIVVCGFDNVGKGMILDTISKGLPVFHPDYSLICNQVSQSGRWSFFMYFLDIFNTFKECFVVTNPMVFDRSALCGAIYNNDYKIAMEYAYRIKDINCIHVLVTCDEDSYNKFVSVRDGGKKFSYQDYLVYTERYRCYMDILGIPYVEYDNKYDPTLGEYLTKVCGGCGHYKSGKCINPKSGVNEVSYDSPRCSYTLEREVQDLDE